MVKKKSKTTTRFPSAKAGDQPATRSMLKLVKGELKEEISKSKYSLEAKIIKMGSGLERKMGYLDNRLSKVEVDLKEVKGEISEVKIMMHKSNLLLEEQNANNRIVLEGLQVLWQKQEQIDKSY